MIEINNTTNYKVDYKKVEFIVDNFLQTFKKKRAIVSLALIGEARMKTLNFKYRRINKTTDVLSFPAYFSDSVKKNSDSNYLGEIIINTKELLKHSKYREMFKDIEVDYFELIKRKKYASYLFYFLLVHGLLHLLGYEDETENERLNMLKIGEKFLENLYKSF